LGNSPLIENLSLNQITTNNLSVEEAVKACVKNEVPWISLWRHKIQETGLQESRKMIKESGLKVSSLCRGGMFPAETLIQRKKNIDDNKLAIEEAAELGTDVLVLVCGPSPNKDIDTSRKWVEEGIEQLIPFAESRGVKLGIEPLHPMYAADRSVVVTLEQANDLSEQLGSKQVGVIVDVFHVWWDPDLYNQIKRAENNILGFHVSDWIIPVPDMFKGRGMMGDGVIEIRRIREAVEASHYNGPIEVEIINQSIWDRPGDEVLIEMKDRYLKHV